MIEVLIILGLLAMLYGVRGTRQPAKEEPENPQRLNDVRAFGKALVSLYPEHLTYEAVAKLTGPDAPGTARVVAKHLLGIYDAVDGPVVGSFRNVLPDGRTMEWPFVAACHRSRGYPAERTITPSAIPVKIPEVTRRRHLFLVGKTGEGKTTLVRNLSLQDIHAGYGVVLVAKEQELLTEEILPFIPPERLNDIIYVDPADPAGVAVNPLHVAPGEDIDLKVDETVTALQRLFADEGPAPRTEALLRYLCASLMRIPGTTLLDMARLLDREDDAYRRSVAARLDDEELRRFWTKTFPLFPKDAGVPLQNRLGRFLGSRYVRNLLCRPGCLDIRGALDEQKILLVSVSDGLLGPSNAAIVGELFVSKFQLAVMSRANAPKDRRPLVHAYLDEFQELCNASPRAYEALLSRARKYGVAVTMATQHCSALPEPVLRAILGNVGSKVIFRVGADDARRLGRELGFRNQVGTDRLLSLRRGEACCQIDRMITFLQTPPPPTGGNPAMRDEAIRRSRDRYGAPASAAIVEERVAQILDIDPNEVF